MSETAKGGLSPVKQNITRICLFDSASVSQSHEHISMSFNL